MELHLECLSDCRFVADVVLWDTVCGTGTFVVLVQCVCDCQIPMSRSRSPF